MKKLLVDARFVASKGSVLVVTDALWLLAQKYEIELWCLKRDKDIYENLCNSRVTLVIRSPVFGIVIPFYVPSKVTTLSFSNLPFFRIGRGTNFTFLHNIFYAFSVFEVMRSRENLDSGFILKLCAFRFLACVSLGSKFLVQTEFMRSRLSKIGFKASVISPFVRIPDLPSLDTMYEICVLAGSGKHKNSDTVIRLLRQINLLHAGFRRCRVIIVGVPGINEDNILPDGGSISFVFAGPLSRIDCLAKMAQSGVIIVPSAAESFCLSFDEIAALEKPIVVSSTECSRERVKVGYFFQPSGDGFYEALFDALTERKPTELSKTGGARLDHVIA